MLQRDALCCVYAEKGMFQREIYRKRYVYFYVNSENTTITILFEKKRKILRYILSLWFLFSTHTHDAILNIRNITLFTNFLPRNSSRCYKHFFVIVSFFVVTWPGYWKGILSPLPKISFNSISSNYFALFTRCLVKLHRTFTLIGEVSQNPRVSTTFGCFE